MATFSKKRLLAASSSQIPQITEAIRQEFETDGFEVDIDNLLSGGSDISITKGNLFKAVLGMRTALKVKLIPQSGGVFFDASVGIFGQQAIPTAITLFVFWPVLLTQIWGLVQQSKLDDRALAAAERAIADSCAPECLADTPSQFCTSCGHRIDSSANFCPYCGVRV